MTFRAGLGGLEALIDRLAEGSFPPLPIDGPDDPLADIRRAFSRAAESIAEMIGVAPHFGRCEP